jgi:hypothetical protein
VGLTLDRWRGFLTVPKTVIFPRLELLAYDNEPRIVTGAGEVQLESLDRFSFRLRGNPEDIDYALSASSRYRTAPYDGLARPRLVGTDSDGVSWLGGYTIPLIETASPTWTFTGEIESLSTDDKGPTVAALASTELLFPLRVGDPMTLAMARFVRTGEPGKELIREREIEALGTKIRFAFEPNNAALSITAAHSVDLPIPYAENWLTEPLRILFGQLLFPRLVARNYGDGRATIWVRPVPSLIRTASWASLLGKDSSS